LSCPVAGPVFVRGCRAGVTAMRVNDEWVPAGFARLRPRAHGAFGWPRLGDDTAGSTHLSLSRACFREGERSEVRLFGSGWGAQGLRREQGFEVGVTGHRILEGERPTRDVFKRSLRRSGERGRHAAGSRGLTLSGDETGWTAAGSTVERDPSRVVPRLTARKQRPREGCGSPKVVISKNGNPMGVSGMKQGREASGGVNR